jgi:pyruvate/2-oxoglutarate dehydrogenase complex dihydrolipoamide acyltransferase (E2) component
VTDQPLVSIETDKATGVEAARFLTAVVTDLERPS